MLNQFDQIVQSVTSEDKEQKPQSPQAPASAQPEKSMQPGVILPPPDTRSLFPDGRPQLSFTSDYSASPLRFGKDHAADLNRRFNLDLTGQPATDHQAMARAVTDKPDELSIVDIFNRYYQKPDLSAEKRQAERRRKAAPFADVALLVSDLITAAAGGDVNIRNRSAMGEAAGYLKGVRDLSRRYDTDYNNRRLALYLKDHAERQRQRDRTDDKNFRREMDEVPRLQWEKNFERTDRWHDQEQQWREKNFNEGSRRYDRQYDLAVKRLNLQKQNIDQNYTYKILKDARQGKAKTFPFAVGNTVYNIPKDLKGQFAMAVIQEAIDKKLLDQSSVIADIAVKAGVNDTQESKQIAYVKDLFNRMPSEMSQLQTLRDYHVSTSPLSSQPQKTIDWGDDSDDTGYIDWPE